jgi:ankyrin repeat protein
LLDEPLSINARVITHIASTGWDSLFQSGNFFQEEFMIKPANSTHSVIEPILSGDVQPDENRVLKALASDDPWLGSNEGETHLALLIEKKPDTVFAAVMEGASTKWEAIAEQCIECHLALDTKKDVLGAMLEAEHATRDGIQKVQFLLKRMGEQDITNILRHTAMNGNLPGLRMISEADNPLLSTSVELLDGSHGSLLHLACQAYQLVIAIFLIENFPELIEKKSSLGATVLHVAAYCDYCAVVPDLLKAAPSLAFTSDVHGRTPLHAAFFCHHTKFVRMLELYVKDYEKLMYQTDSCGWTVLHYLANSSPFEHAADIIADTAKLFPPLLAMYGDQGESPLHVAILCGNLDAARILLLAAPHLAKRQTIDGDTGLEIAIRHEQKGSVKQLVSALSKEVDDNGRTVLFRAFEDCIRSQLDAHKKAIARNLRESITLDKDKKAIARIQWNGMTLEENENTKKARLFVDGIAPTERNKDIVRLLWEGITHPNTQGRVTGKAIVLEAARSKGGSAVLSTVLELVPELAGSKDPEEKPLLHIAAEAGNLDVVNCLIRFFKNENTLKDRLSYHIKGGRRAIDIALSEGHVYIVSALLSANNGLSDQFGSLAPVFDTKTDRPEWRELAVQIADNDYARFLAPGVSEKKFREFTKMLSTLTERDIAQRLVTFAAWSDEVGEDPRHVMEYQDDIEACGWLKELLSDGWLASGKSWKAIQQEAMIAIRQLCSEDKLPESRLGRNILARLTPLLNDENSSQLSEIINTGMIEMTEIVSVPTRRTTSDYQLNPNASPYYPVSHPKHWENVDLTRQFQDYSLNIRDYSQYFFEGPSKLNRHSLSENFDKRK